ncbi:17791_t:CDS:2, partial [Acaulospora morrowiae]
MGCTAPGHLSPPNYVVVDKATIPLAEFAISHFVALEECVEKIAKDFKYRSSQFTPPALMSFVASKDEAEFIARIAELERSAKESANNEKRSQIENSKLKGSVTKLEFDIREIKQKQIIPIENHLDIKNAQITESISNDLSISPKLNSDEHQEKTESRVSNSYSTKLSICVKSKSSEDKEMDDFLIRKKKETVSNLMRDGNREKKLQRTISSEISQNTITHSQKIIQSEPETFNESEKITISDAKKIPYNEKVEHEAILRGSSEVTAEIIASGKSTTMNENRKVISVPNWNAHVAEQTLPKIESLQETIISVTPERVSPITSSYLVTASGNKSRPSISILPDDPEEKRKSVINKVLERFPDYFDCSTICPICNNDHKKENIRDNIQDLWGS